MTNLQQQPWFPKIDSEKVPWESQVHFQALYSAHNNHEQAIAGLNEKITALQTQLAALTGTTTSG